MLHSRPTRAAALLLSLLLISAMIVALPVSASARTYKKAIPVKTYNEEVTAKPVVYNGANWMGKLDKDLPLYVVSLPATHDSCTFNIRFEKTVVYNAIVEAIDSSLKGLGSALLKLLTAPIDAAVSNIATYFQEEAGKCQTLDITEQLNAGVRSLDLRYGYSEEDKKFYLYHGKGGDGTDSTKDKLMDIFAVCQCYSRDGKKLTLDMVFSDIQKFLKKNPTEVVLINLSRENGAKGALVDQLLAELKKDYLIADGKDIASQPIGKLAGKVFDYSAAEVDEIGNVGPIDWNGKVFNDGDDKTDGADKVDWDAPADVRKEYVIKALESAEKAKDVKPGFRGIYLNLGMKFFKIHDPYEECEFRWELKYPKFFPLFPTGIQFDRDKMFMTPKSLAEKMNTIIDDLGTFRGVKLEPGQIFGFISFDFANKDRCFKIVSLNNLNPQSGVTFVK